MVTQRYPCDVLHDEKELLGRFDDLIQLDDVRVPNQLQNVNLSADALNICHIKNLVLFQDLDCYHFSCGFVRRQFDLAESALPQSLP